MTVRCGKCGGHPYVVDKRKKQIKMECLDCGVRWITESKICPKCHRGNGYAVDGLCAQCYSAQLSNKQ